MALKLFFQKGRQGRLAKIGGYRRRNRSAEGNRSRAHKGATDLSRPGRRRVKVCAERAGLIWMKSTAHLQEVVGSTLLISDVDRYHQFGRSQGNLNPDEIGTYLLGDDDGVDVEGFI